MTETSKLLVQLAFVLPLFFFLCAYVFEFRRDRQSLRSLGRFGPLIMGVIAATLLLIPVTWFLSTTHSSVVLSRVMASFSISVAASGVLSRFKSRLASALVVAGGTILAFFWFFNRVMV